MDGGIRERYMDGESISAKFWNSKGEPDDGLIFNWHKNGKTSYKAKFKGSKRIYEKFWNSKGEPVDSMEEAEK